MLVGISIKIIAISFTAMVGTSALANGNGKDACLTKPDPKAHSAWRIIEGKRCWYRGYRGRARESLYWLPVGEPPALVKRAPAREVPPRPLDGLDRAPSQGAEPLKDRIDRDLAAIAANQQQPPTSSVPLPPPKPANSWWYNLWQRFLGVMNWLFGGT